MTASNTPAESAFNPFTAGIEFMQQFTKNMAANSGLGSTGLGEAASKGLGAIPNFPGLPSWAMPTTDTAELEKRINELKTVQFWLEQNTNALKASIQALEVQKMTLQTLKTMSEGMANATFTQTSQATTDTAARAAASAKSNTTRSKK